MNKRKFFCTMLSMGHFSVGISILFSYGYLAESPAWIIAEKVGPYWLWAALFFLVGLTAVMGLFDDEKNWLRRSFFLAGVMMLIWAGFSTVASFIYYPPNWTGSLFLFYLAVMKFAISYYDIAVQKAVEKATVREDQLLQITERLKDAVSN